MTNREPSVSQYKSKSGLKRIFSALFNSLNGLRTAWRLEHAFRHELGVAIPGIIVALLLPVTLLERVALIAVLVLMLITELVNSAIEAVVIGFPSTTTNSPKTPRIWAVPPSCWRWYWRC